jgi:hypothetical protein
MKSFLTVPTVDSIVAKINKLQDQMLEVEVASLAHAAEYGKAAALANERQDVALKEAERANRIVEHLKALVA